MDVMVVMEENCLLRQKKPYDFDYTFSKTPEAKIGS